MQVSAQATDNAIAREVERVIAREVRAERLRALLEQRGGFDRDLWSLAAEQGWPAMALPEQAGGLGLGWAELAETAGILGRVTASLPLLQNTLVARLLLTAENTGAWHATARRLAAGTCIACLAVPAKGDAGLTPRLPVTLEGGTLTGEVAQTPFAAVADVALVPARSGAATVLALAKLDSRGVERRVGDLIDNARGAAALRFEAVPAVDIALAHVSVLEQVLLPAAVITAFEQIGGADASLELARDHALEHRAFGQPIGAFQAIKHKLADVYTQIEVARGCALEALEELARGELSVEAAAAARIAASRAYDFAAQEAIQVHGGMGIMWASFLHHHYRRARSLALELGSPAYWRKQLLEQLRGEGS